MPILPARVGLGWARARWQTGRVKGADGWDPLGLRLLYSYSHLVLGWGIPSPTYYRFFFFLFCS